METGSPRMKNSVNEAVITPSMLDVTSNSEANLFASLHLPPQSSSGGAPPFSTLIMSEGDSGSASFRIAGAKEQPRLGMTTDSSSALAGTTSSILSTTLNTTLSSLNNTGNGTLVMRNVYISGLPPHFRPKDFRKMCQAFGHIEASKLSIDSNARPTKGYGFALFYTEESAAACIEALNGRELCGRILQARFSRAAATPKEAAPRTNQPIHATSPSQQPAAPSRSHGHRDVASPTPSAFSTQFISPMPSSPPMTTLSTDIAAAPQIIYPAMAPPSWPAGLGTPAGAQAAYQQVVLINGQYYTLPPAATAPAMPCYPFLSPSSVPQGVEGLAPTGSHSVMNSPPSESSTAPFQFTTLPSGPVQMPTYYFLPQ